MNIDAQTRPSDYGNAGNRRYRPRVPLRWPLSIRQLPGDMHVLAADTENLSSRGFCCVVDEPLVAGEAIACILKFPPHIDSVRSHALRCAGHVVWVRAADDGRYRVGCRIDDYAIIGLNLSAIP